MTFIVLLQNQTLYVLVKGRKNKPTTNLQTFIKYLWKHIYTRTYHTHRHASAYHPFHTPIHHTYQTHTTYPSLYHTHPIPHAFTPTYHTHPAPLMHTCHTHIISTHLFIYTYHHTWHAHHIHHMHPYHPNITHTEPKVILNLRSCLSLPSSELTEMHDCVQHFESS